MFYDLEPDPPGVGVNSMPRPLLELDSLQEQLRDWDACTIPWRAGLPNFARITVYDRDGRSRGHVRGWKWSDLCFNEALRTTNALDAATVLLRSDRRTQLARSVMAQGESVAARFPDRAALAGAFDAAAGSRANGVILFRLPDESDGSGWSLTQLLNLKQQTAPRLTLRRPARPEALPDERLGRRCRATSHRTGGRSRSQLCSRSGRAGGCLARSDGGRFLARRRACSHRRTEAASCANPAGDALDLLVQPHASWRPIHHRARPNSARHRSLELTLPHPQPARRRPLAPDRMKAARASLRVLFASARAPGVAYAQRTVVRGSAAHASVLPPSPAGEDVGADSKRKRPRPTEEIPSPISR